jgi:hypothetical protein
MIRRTTPFLVLSAGLLAACGGGQDHMTNAGPGGSGMMGGGATGAALLSLVPQGGMVGVSTTTPLSFRFGGPMAPGMEQYFDLHMGGIDGPVVPMSCGWSADRTTLTCTPGAPLLPRTTYAVHIGGGMMDASGRPASFDAYGPMMGGQWIVGGMMTDNHGGGSWSMMGPGWRHTNGSYGMVFTFTTA